MGLVNAVMFSLQRHTTIVYLENLAVFKLSLSRHPAPRAQGNMLYYTKKVQKKLPMKILKDIWLIKKFLTLL